MFTGENEMASSRMVCGEWVSAVIVSLVLVLVLPEVQAYETGAPFSVCDTMLPGHGSEQSYPSPYSIQLSSSTYSANVPITGTDRLIW